MPLVGLSHNVTTLLAKDDKTEQSICQLNVEIIFPENSSCFGDAHDLLHTTRKKADSEMSVWCGGSCVGKVH